MCCETVKDGYDLLLCLPSMKGYHSTYLSAHLFLRPCLPINPLL